MLSSIPQLLYGFSTRADGSMRVQSREDLTKRERLHFFRAIGVSADRTAGCSLTHGRRVQQVDTGERRPLFFHHTDGLYTLDISRVLTVTGADCFPLFVVDPVTRVFGLCHAGWRGAVDGILPELLIQMNKRLGARLENLRVVIGPGIRACHFEIKMDVWSKVQDTYLIKEEGKTCLDLPRLLMDQALELGVTPDHLEDTGICTLCDKRYFSYRRDKPKEIEAQMAYLGWRV